MPHTALGVLALLAVVTSRGALRAAPDAAAPPAPAVRPDAGVGASRPLSLQEAVARAEQFVRDCGLTQHPPAQGPPAPGCRDSIQTLFGDTVWRGHLKASAVGVLRARKGGEAGWAVGFAYTPEALRGLPREAQEQGTRAGRAVTMDPDGSNLRIEHVDVKLSALEPLPHTQEGGTPVESKPPRP